MIPPLNKQAPEHGFVQGLRRSETNRRHHGEQKKVSRERRELVSQEGPFKGCMTKKSTIAIANPTTKREYALTASSVIESPPFRRILSSSHSLPIEQQYGCQKALVKSISIYFNKLYNIFQLIYRSIPVVCQAQVWTNKHTAAYCRFSIAD